MSALSVPPQRRTGLLVWLIISQLLALGSLLIWLIVAGLSVMAFDSGESPTAWTIVIAVWAYPLFPLLMEAGAWIAYAFRKNKLSALAFSGVTCGRFPDWSTIC